MFSNIDKNTIIVCNNNYKKIILNNFYKNKKIVSFKIMNISEFIDNLTLTFDTKTIYYVMNKYNVKYDVALIYLKNLIYVDNYVDNSKISFLYNLKNELIKESLLKENNLFKNYIKSKKIIFYNLNYDLKFIKHLCKDLNIEFINDDINIVYEKEIKHFKNINDEIIYVGESIINLLNNDIDISRIKIVGLPSEYRYPLKLIFECLNLNINTNNSNIFASNVCKYFLDNLKENINDTITLVKDKYNGNKILDEIINICNKYYWCDNYLDIKELLINEFKKAKIPCDKLANEIEIIDYLDMDSNSDNYYYLMGFNNENIPINYKDTEYISDNICYLVNKETSNEKYLREKSLLIKKIKSIKNLTITYKEKTYFNEYLISNLIDDLGYKVVDIDKNDSSYSYLLSHLKLTEQIDRYEKYGETSDELEMLYNSIDTDYKTYDNNFKGIDKEELIKYLDNKLLLSYSSVDNFYKCAFKYYINNLLKLDEFKENFSAYIGSLMHYILSKYNSDNFNFDSEFNNYILDNDYELSPKEEFFLEKVKDYLKFIIDELKYQKTLTSFDKELYEEKIIIEKDNKIKLTFMGIIDKIMYLEKNGNTYLALVDYKTGSIDTNLKYVKNGLQLQLPIYAYLIKESNKFTNPIISGLYYQKLLDNEIKETTEEEYLKEKKSHLKLQGISTSDESVLEMFDSTYENSDLIKSMKKTSKGFSAYSKVFGKEEIEELINLAKTKIEEAAKNICEGNFMINPKQIKFDNISCKYCKYKDLCFRTPDNTITIEEGE